MSEYQYYEFLPVDRPLDDHQQAEVRFTVHPRSDHRHQLRQRGLSVGVGEQPLQWLESLPGGRPKGFWF